MPRTCDLCLRGTQIGQNVPTKGLPRKKGGGGQHRGVQTKKYNLINLVNAKVKKGSQTLRVRVCTHCLKASKLELLSSYL